MGYGVSEAYSANGYYFPIKQIQYDVYGPDAAIIGTLTYDNAKRVFYVDYNGDDDIIEVDAEKLRDKSDELMKSPVFAATASLMASMFARNEVFDIEQRNKEIFEKSKDAAQN